MREIIIEKYRNMGYENIAMYYETFGLQPIISFIRGAESYDEMESIAKICLENGKTAKELGFLDIKSGIVL